MALARKNEEFPQRPQLKVLSSPIEPSTRVQWRDLTWLFFFGLLAAPAVFFSLVYGSMLLTAFNA